MKTIELTRGYSCCVDDEDYDWLNQWKWYALCDGRAQIYAARSLGGSRSPERSLIRMHRVITNAPTGRQVDHIDGNTLNNCRRNLRLCSRSQNRRNRKKCAQSVSHFIGVCPAERPRGKWMAQIKTNGRTRYLGLHDTEESAALAYDQAALAEYGEFAKLNFGGKYEGMLV